MNERWLKNEVFLMYNIHKQKLVISAKENIRFFKRPIQAEDCPIWRKVPLVINYTV
jgi:hypothetical protein